jgi:hypothetical protein
LFVWLEQTDRERERGLRLSLFIRFAGRAAFCDDVGASWVSLTCLIYIG